MLFFVDETWQEIEGERVSRTGTSAPKATT
jgi:hypothetical protein